MDLFTTTVRPATVGQQQTAMTLTPPIDYRLRLFLSSPLSEGELVGQFREQLVGAKLVRGCIEYSGNILDFERNWMFDELPESMGESADLCKYEYDVSVFPIVEVGLEHQRQLSRDIRSALAALHLEHTLLHLWDERDDV